MMAVGANIRSIEALEVFRRALVMFRSAANTLLDDTDAAVVSTRLWLEGEQRSRWERELRRRGDVVTQAKRVLSGARMSKRRGTLETAQMEVRRAMVRLREAEGKLAAVKAWRVRYDAQVAPMLKPLDSLRTVVNGELVRAIAYLRDAGRALADYAGTTAGSGRSAPGDDREEGEGASEKEGVYCSGWCVLRAFGSGGFGF